MVTCHSEELVNVAMQIESEIDYLHIREREKSTEGIVEVWKVF